MDLPCINKTLSIYLSKPAISTVDSCFVIFGTLLYGLETIIKSIIKSNIIGLQL